MTFIKFNRLVIELKKYQICNKKLKGTKMNWLNFIKLKLFRNR
jgi:hypothetical protein